MATATKTLKLPFYRLNQSKADEFARLQALNTRVANELLAMPGEQRRQLTSKSFAHIEIGSAWINQTIRNAKGVWYACLSVSYGSSRARAVRTLDRP